MYTKFQYLNINNFSLCNLHKIVKSDRRVETSSIKKQTKTKIEVMSIGFDTKPKVKVINTIK